MQCCPYSHIFPLLESVNIAILPDMVTENLSVRWDPAPIQTLCLGLHKLYVSMLTPSIPSMSSRLSALSKIEIWWQLKLDRPDSSSYGTIPGVPMPSIARKSFGDSAMSVPSHVTVPSVGFVTVARIRIRMDLLAPFYPSSPRIPKPSVRLKSFSAQNPPLCSFSIRLMTSSIFIAPESE